MREFLQIEPIARTLLEHCRPASPVLSSAAQCEHTPIPLQCSRYPARSIIKSQLHATAVHVEFAGDQFHMLVLLFVL